MLSARGFEPCDCICYDPMTAYSFIYLLFTFGVLTLLSGAASNGQSGNKQTVKPSNTMTIKQTDSFSKMRRFDYRKQIPVTVTNRVASNRIIDDSVPSTYDLIIQYKAKKRWSRYMNEARRRREIVDPNERQRRQSPDEIDPCEPFTNHEFTHKIYHPGYPKNYLKKMDCVTTISNYEGYIIKLDFRDIFELENASDVSDTQNCTHDYLEIRDGPYGYNDVLGKFCGNKFPDIIRSKGPYMWLRFHSDETLEYAGFHAEYEFEANSASKKQPPSCVKEIEDQYYGRIRRDDINETCISEYYKDNQPVDALFNVRVPEGWKLLLNFTYFELAEPNECKKNFVEIFGDKTEEPNRIKYFCGSMADTFVTDTNSMFLRFFAAPSASKSNFSVEFTAFRKSDGRSCDEDEFDCEDATCIKNYLTCDNSANCRLKVDEDEEMCNKGQTANLLQSEHIVIILVIFSLILSGMVFVFFYKCIKKLVEDHKTIKEQIRQSREDGIDKFVNSKTSLHELKLEELAARSSRDNMTNHHIQHKNIERSPSPERRWSREKSRSSSRPASRLSSHRSVRSRSPPGTCEVSVCAPDVKDSGCQTRDSLFQMEPIRATDRVSPRPDSLSTFRPPSMGPQLTIQIMPPVRKMFPPAINRRPDSCDTTRSAPDVIIVANTSP